LDIKTTPLAAHKMILIKEGCAYTMTYTEVEIKKKAEVENEHKTK